MSESIKISLVSVLLAGLGKFFMDAFDNIGEGAEVYSSTFKNFRSKSKTGDLILTSATTLTSVTRFVTTSLYSHVGVIYKKGTIIYEWSSHSTAEQLGNGSGTQLNRIEDIIANSGQIFWCPIEIDEEKARRIEEYIGASLQKMDFPSIFSFISYGKGPFSKLSDEMTVNCAQLVALTYLAADAIEIDRYIGYYTPSSFVDGDNVKWRVNRSKKTYVIYGLNGKKKIDLKDKE